MIRAAVLTVLGLFAGMASSVANAQFFYSPVGYYQTGIYPVRPVYSAPIPVGVAYYAAPAPVIVARPVYVSPVVQTVYSAPVYTSSISTVSYSTNLEPTPVYEAPTPTYYEPAVTYVAPAPVYVSRPVYVTPAPVYVSRAVYSPAVYHESLRVGPFSSTYRAHGYGYSAYARSGPYRTVVRTRGW